MENAFGLVFEDMTLTVQPHQVEHYVHLQKIFEKWFVALDNSETGSGKTVITVGLAMAMGLSLVIVAPPIVHTQWRDTAKRYGVSIIHVTSYQLLVQRSTLLKKLSAKEWQEKGGNGPSEFEHTDTFAKLLQHGILLVFDESHNLKTDKTQQLRACHTLIRALVHNPSTISRAILLSATPCDKAEHAVSMVKMLGILTHCELSADGIIEVAEIAREMNSIALTAISSDYGGQIKAFTRMKSARAKQFVYEAYRDIFGPTLSSSAKLLQQTKMADKPGGLIHSRLNGFYRFPEEDNRKLKKAHDLFVTSLTRFGKQTEDEESIHMTELFIEMESAKVPTIARLVRKTLSENPGTKVIVYMNFKPSLEALASALVAYAPMILNGPVGKAERDKIMALFQKPSDEARLLISHPLVGGVGANLDDTDGKFPRVQFFSPSYSFIQICQSMGRVSRTSTKSSSQSYLVFSNAVPEELRLLDNLGRKAVTMRDFKTESDITYPGEYPSYHEE